MSDKNNFIKGILCGAAAAFIVVAAVLLGSKVLQIEKGSVQRDNLIQSSEEAGDQNILDKEALAKLQSIQQVIGQSFYKDAKEEDLKNMLYKGLMWGLGDPYSSYYTAEEYKELEEGVTGSYYGIGVQVTQQRDSGQVVMTRIFKDSPAAEGGLLPGDILMAINETDISGLDLTQVVNKIKTAEGEKVQLTIFRDGGDAPLQLPIERREVKEETVIGEMMDNNIGFITITQFEDTTSKQFGDILDGLESQGMEGLVVDLRNNPGGTLKGVVGTVNRILGSGNIFYTENKKGEQKKYDADSEQSFEQPLVVLVNGQSASASEVFAGAVKDHGIGTLVGTKTFGKGIVQSIIPFDDGSAVKITTDRYFTPNGNDIHEIGIDPDVEIELAEDLKKKIAIPHEQDNQLQKALEVMNGKLQK